MLTQLIIAYYLVHVTFSRSPRSTVKSGSDSHIVNSMDSELLKRFQPKLHTNTSRSQATNWLRLQRSWIQRSRSQTIFFKNALFRRMHTVLSIATNKCKFVKASASGWLCPHAYTRGVPLYPAGGITNHISRPNWLHQLYNTSRASGLLTVAHCGPVIECKTVIELVEPCCRRWTCWAPASYWCTASPRSISSCVCRATRTRTTTTPRTTWDQISLHITSAHTHLLRAMTSHVTCA